MAMNVASGMASRPTWAPSVSVTKLVGTNTRIVPSNTQAKTSHLPRLTESLTKLRPVIFQLRLLRRLALAVGHHGVLSSSSSAGASHGVAHPSFALSSVASIGVVAGPTAGDTGAVSTTPPPPPPPAPTNAG